MRHNWDDSVRPSECLGCGARGRTGAGSCPGPSNLLARAARAGMSPWAYAVHTGNVRDLHVATMLRAQTDHEFCMSRLRQAIRRRGSLFAITVLAAMVLLGGCTVGGRLHASRMTLGAALATTACDWGQTRSAAMTGWASRYEANPIMGPSPSVGTVDVYMAVAVAGSVAAYTLLPEQVRPYALAAIAVVEGRTVVDNLRTTDGLCGISGDRAR